MKKYTYYIIALFALFSSCTNAEFEFSSDSCYFIFDNTANRSPMLGTAMNSVSPGVFCHIAVSGKYFVFNTNTAPGQTERVAFNAVDEQRSLILGAYNESGIIVGYGNLNSPAVFYAYDNQCPNCYRSSNLPRYGLSMDTSGKATCSNCKRVYDMNNGGIVSDGDPGDKLIRYRCTTTGPMGVLSVINGQ